MNERWLSTAAFAAVFGVLALLGLSMLVLLWISEILPRLGYLIPEAR